MADEPQEPSSEQMQEELKAKLEQEEARYAIERTYGADQSSPATGLGISRAATVRAQMVLQMKELEARANEIKNLIKLFDENPNVEKILNSMRRLGF